MTEYGILKPSDHIKRIIKLPSQDFLTVELESGERTFHDRNKKKLI